MAKTKTAVPATATAKRRGRPSNASKAAAAASQTVNLIDIAIAAASSAVKTALGVDSSTGTVSTVTSIAQPSASAAAKKSPGRKRNPDSALSLTRKLYAENMAKPESKRMTRAEFVKAAAAKFGYSIQTANTYVSGIEKNAPVKLVSRAKKAA